LAEYQVLPYQIAFEEVGLVAVDAVVWVVPSEKVSPPRPKDAALEYAGEVI
jgi:hypothetical protein